MVLRCRTLRQWIDASERQSIPLVPHSSQLGSAAGRSEGPTESHTEAFFPYDVIQPPDAVKRSFELFVHAPTDWRRQTEAIKPAKSTEIRRVVKLALTQVISPLHTSHQGGGWQYDGLLNGRDITVNIDYHQKYAQFQYGITHPLQSQEVGKLRVDLSYEGLLGVGRGAWDMVELSYLDQSIALLRDLIIRCHDFLELLPTSNESTTRT